MSIRSDGLEVFLEEATTSLHGAEAEIGSGKSVELAVEVTCATMIANALHDIADAIRATTEKESTT